MPADYDMNAETDSEDGGVALSVFEFSDTMEVDHESAPTSASQSPIQSGTSLTNALGNISALVAEGTPQSGPSAALATEAPSLSIASHPLSHLQEGHAHTPPTDLVSANITSFADTLSGELMGVPEGSGFHWDENATSPPSETWGMPALSPIPSTIQPHSLLAHGHGPLEAATGGPWQTIQQHVEYEEGHLPSNPHHDDPIGSLPSLSDVFGSDFLTQTMGPLQTQVSNAAGVMIGDDWADTWDDIEDNIRNPQCDAFFNYWKAMYTRGMPDFPRISDLANHIPQTQRPGRISVEDLGPEESDKSDFQGIYWSRFQTTKKDAREVRRMTYSNHVNYTKYCQRLISNIAPFGSRSYKVKFCDASIPSSRGFFGFKETNLRFRSYISHFQLRHNIFASSKNALFYNHRPRLNYGYGAGMGNFEGCDAKIMCYNTAMSTDECVMDLTRLIHKDAPRVIRPSTLTAAEGVLVVGSFEGAYAMKSLSANFESRPTTGVITRNGDNGSTNHIQNFLDRRSGLPQAAFSSNDSTVRVLDCTTDTWVRTHHFPYQVNCSATSPDGRLRLLVGDDCHPILADAEKGELLATLPGHTNFGFACAWAPDGITMATGAQDGFVQVWDARMLKQPLQRIPMEMAGSRTLQFSPLGGGKRVLVIAEPADFVHVVDAQTFESKQVIEFFGEIAGISMPPDGTRLYIANQDPTYGGLMEFERCWGTGDEGYQRPRRRKVKAVNGNLEDDMTDLFHDNGAYERYSNEPKWSRHNHLDWLPEEALEDDERVVLSWPHRNGRGLVMRDEMV